MGDQLLCCGGLYLDGGLPANCASDSELLGLVSLSWQPHHWLYGSQRTLWYNGGLPYLPNKTPLKIEKINSSIIHKHLLFFYLNAQAVHLCRLWLIGQCFFNWQKAQRRLHANNHPPHLTVPINHFVEISSYGIWSLDGDISPSLMGLFKRYHIIE